MIYRILSDKIKKMKKSLIKKVMIKDIKSLKIYKKNKILRLI